MTLEQDILKILINVQAEQAIRAFAIMQKQFEATANSIQKKAMMINHAVASAIAPTRDTTGVKALSSYYENMQAQIKSMAPLAKQLFISDAPARIAEQAANAIVANQKMQENYWKSYMSNVKGAERLTTDYTGKAAAGIKRMNSQMLGFGLSMLFTGMAVQRLGQTVVNSLVKTFMTATDEQNRFNQELVAVQASFEFLKFSIMDALNTDVVIGFLEGVINITNAVSEFVNKHPQISLIIGTFSVMAIVLGGIAMVLGQISLLAVGLGTSLFPLLGVLALIAGFVALLVSLLADDMKKANPILTGIKLLFISIGIIIATLISPILGVIFLFVTIGAIIGKLRFDFGSFGNVFKGVIRGLIMVLGFLGQFLVEGILLPFQLIAVALIRLIGLSNRFAGTNISTKGLESFVEYKPDIVGSAATLADKIKLDETKGALFNGGQAGGQGNVTNITVNGDVTDAHLMDKIKKGLDEQMEDFSKRYGGTPQES